METNELQFTKLVKEQKNNIYTVCLMFADDNDDVEDLVQLTLVNLWKGFKNFEGRSSIGTWVWRVAMNTCITADRKKKRRRQHEDVVDTLGLKEVKTDASDDRQVQQLYSRIRRLGVFDRAIVLLWLENLSYDEIGAIVGITPKNVGVRLVRIRQQLKEME